jgi:hypothetical protein
MSEQYVDTHSSFKGIPFLRSKIRYYLFSLYARLLIPLPSVSTFGVLVMVLVILVHYISRFILHMQSLLQRVEH